MHFGDRQGRGRLKSNCETRKTYYARGGAIITGEYLPYLTESRRARCIVIPFNKETLDITKVKELEEYKEEWAFAMKVYIRWLIVNMEGIVNEARIYKDKIAEIQDASIHGRIQEAINILNFGFHLYLTFMLTNGIIQEQEKEQLESEAEKVLTQIAFNQVATIQENDIINLFYEAIEELINTDKIYLLNYNNDLSLKEQPKGKLVGFIDEKEGYYYFYPKTIFAEVTSFYKRLGGEFPVNKNYLWDIMADEGLIYLTSKNRKTVERIDKQTGKKVTVIGIKIKDKQGMEQEQHTETIQNLVTNISTLNNVSTPTINVSENVTTLENNINNLVKEKAIKPRGSLI